MTTKRSEFLTGIKDILPILMGVIPFGLIYGVSARSAGIAPAAAQAMSFIVFAGSAQFVTAQLIGAAVPGGIIILTAVIINLRHALYSASFAPYLKRLHPLWQFSLRRCPASILFLWLRNVGLFTALRLKAHANSNADERCDDQTELER